MAAPDYASSGEETRCLVLHVESCKLDALDI